MQADWKLLEEQVVASLASGPKQLRDLAADVVAAEPSARTHTAIHAVSRLIDRRVIDLTLDHKYALRDLDAAPAAGG